MAHLRSCAVRPFAAGDVRLAQMSTRLATRPHQLLAAEERHVDALAARIRALDPVNVLARGWTITRHADGRIVRSPDDLDVDDVLITQFAAGTSTSRVIAGEDDA